MTKSDKKYFHYFRISGPGFPALSRARAHIRCVRLIGYTLHTVHPHLHRHRIPQSRYSDTLWHIHAACHRVSGAGPISTTHYEWEHVTRCTQPGAPTCPYMGHMRSRDWAVITWPLARSIYGYSGKQRSSDAIYGHELAAVSCDPDCQPLKIAL